MIPICNSFHIYIHPCLPTRMLHMGDGRPPKKQPESPGIGLWQGRTGFDARRLDSDDIVTSFWNKAQSCMLKSGKIISVTGESEVDFLSVLHKGNGGKGNSRERASGLAEDVVAFRL